MDADCRRVASVAPPLPEGGEAVGKWLPSTTVVRSTDTAETTTPAGTPLPLWGIISQLAAAPNGTLLVSSDSIGSWTYRNAGGQTWTTSEDLGGGGIGWNDTSRSLPIGLGTSSNGPVFCCGGYGPGELWKTDDGGLTWRQTEVTAGP